MRKQNCWEFKNCGRQPGAKLSKEGVCPAVSNEEFDGIHDGTNSGRACWTVARTLCSGKAEGSEEQKSKKCLICDFYAKVREQEGQGFMRTSGAMGIFLMKHRMQKV